MLALQTRPEICSEGASFSLPTTDIKKDHEALRKKKVKFWKDLSEEPYGWVLMPKDSEGNIFEIVQPAKNGKRSKVSVIGMLSGGKKGKLRTSTR